MSPLRASRRRDPTSRGRWKRAAVVATLGAVLVTALILSNESPLSHRAPVSAVVYLSKTCSCCRRWVEHLRSNGFDVKTEEVEDLRAVRARVGDPDEMASCHTAVIGDYFVEGHVPADAIYRILDDPPRIKGVAVPEMPYGPPGMGATTGIRYKIWVLTQSGSRDRI